MLNRKRILWKSAAAGSGMEQMNNQGQQQSSQLQTNDQQSQLTQGTDFMDYDEAIGETLQVIARSANQAFDLHNQKMAEKTGQPMRQNMQGQIGSQPNLNNNPAVMPQGQGTNGQSQQGTPPPSQQNNQMSKSARWDVLLGNGAHPSVQAQGLNNFPYFEKNAYVRMMQSAMRTGHVPTEFLPKTKALAKEVSDKISTRTSRYPGMLPGGKHPTQDTLSSLKRGRGEAGTSGSYAAGRQDLKKSINLPG